MASQFSCQAVVLVAICWWTLAYAQSNVVDEVPSGVLVIGGSGVMINIPTRIGCRELIRCEGNGTEVVWKRFSRRSALTSEDNREITVMTGGDPDMDGLLSFVSHLIFDPVMLTDSGFFTCTINSQTHTARLRVLPDVAEITISHFDLSDRTIGDTLAVLCSVASCLPNITVQFLQGDTVLNSSVVADAEAMVAQFNPTVTENLVGEYTCKALVDFMGVPMAFTKNFNITGTPMAIPTTTAPPAGATQNPAGTSKPTNSGHQLHVSLCVLFSLLMLSGVWLLVQA